MKNIHVIPANKPSRLYKRNDLKNYYLGDFDICNPNDNLRTNQHIYITSDEEIKFNDYITDGYKVLQWKDDSSLLGRKKVILSTDQDLNGVQAIDDDFLEWFVSKANDSGVPIDIVDVISIMPKGYKIIIPKEEPKCTCKEHDPYCCQVHGICPTCVKKEEQKQHLIDMMKYDEKLGLYDETLEEVAENYSFTAFSGRQDLYDGFIAGAKWQAERMYSEEVINEMFDTLKRNAVNNVATITNIDLFISSWKQELKKK